jgi:asparagine synthase (glutamine-hydrolysing)
MQSLLAPIWNDVKHVDTRGIFSDVFNTHAANFTQPEDYINHSMYFEARTFLHGLLVVEDKLSMAHSLETRVPFLDNDLVDFAMKIPARMKLGNLANVIQLNENEPGSKTAKYFEKTQDGKLLLRKVMERHIPAKITNREKQGFSAPDASWFKGESMEYVRRKLYQGHPRIYEFLDRGAVQSLANEHLEGKQNRRLLIWSLLSLEKWCEVYLR